MWLTETGLKENCSSGIAGGGKKKFSSSAKVFAQRCVIKQERWPTKASNGCSLKCLRRRGMFFSCQPAFDAGERGGDLAPPCACDGPTQVFRTIPCCRALDKLCEVPLATAVVWKKKRRFVCFCRLCEMELYVATNNQPTSAYLHDETFTKLRTDS